ncbi:MAG: hypothetical protein GAK38_04452 [Xylophilus sp.]|nr:MAG: hypothetical protein GAK38_04452 [Xylophilus sp.]
MLENHADAKFSCRSWFVDRYRLTFPDDLALQRLERAEQHFHECGFASTVFTQKGVYFPSFDDEIYRIARSELTKYFSESADIQKRPVG